MPTYTYHARTPSGEIIAGTQEALDERSAVQRLHDQGYYVTELRASRLPAEGGGGPIGDRILGGPNPREMALFYRQLATSINAGIGVGRSVELASMGTHGRLRAGLQGIAATTANGVPLSVALQERPVLFGKVELALIRAGESSGKLETVIHLCATINERMWHLGQRVRSAMVYPCIMLFASLAIPLIVGMVTKSPAEVVRTMLLPELLDLGLLIFAYFAFRSVIRFERPGRIWDSLIFKVPIMGRNAWKGCSARFLRTFADLYDVGISPRESLTVAANACGNRAMAERIVRAKPIIEGGGPLSEAFASTRIVPPLALQMLATGEVSGNVSESLNKAADYLESEVETSTDSWMQALPVLLYMLIAIPMIFQIIGMWGGYAQNLMKVTDQ